MWKISTIKKLRAFALLAAVALTLAGCGSPKPDAPAEVRLDGQVCSGGSISPKSDDSLRVYITLDGAALIDLPFGEAHRVTVTQANGAENEIELTGEAVRMEHANCENQDCVNMGAVTRENLELRVMGGFIICLPHKLSVEVRDS